MKSLNKLVKLKRYIRKCRSVVIAYSGGVDSTFLARVSGEILGKENTLLVTAASSTYPEHELEEAKKIATFLNLEHEIIVSEEIDIPGFADNPPDRCYYCKSELFRKIRPLADERMFNDVFDGSNLDDLEDYRPGRKALQEYHVKSPLLETGFTKTDIRILSKHYRLPTAVKQSYACLASRFPYGEGITRQKLDRVGKAELAIRQLGFCQIRVRSHQDLARIELGKEEMEKAWEMRADLTEVCLQAGFSYVSLDLQGYRTGSMNEVLKV